jgi:hypothetical protein
MDVSSVRIPEMDAGTADMLSAGLPGRRPPSDRELALENRRRKREGLPPVVDSVTPSAGGWGEETPSPDADSLAAQYVRRRKSTGAGRDDERRGPDGSGNGDRDDYDL